MQEQWSRRNNRQIIYFWVVRRSRALGTAIIAKRTDGVLRMAKIIIQTIDRLVRQQ